MFGIADYITIHLSQPYLRRVVHDDTAHFDMQVTRKTFDDAKKIWICFPGWGTDASFDDSGWGAWHMLPKEGTVYSFCGPRAIGGKTPAHVQQAMDQVEVEVQGILSRHSGCALGVFGFSAGTMPAFYVANTYGAAELIALAPGASMGRGILLSRLTKPFRDHAHAQGYTSVAQYDAPIAMYNPENNVDKLHDTKISVVMGRCDRIIDHWASMEIVHMMRDAGLDPAVRTYWMFDHVSLAAFYGLFNKFGWRRADGIPL